MGGGPTGYSSVPRFEAPDIPTPPSSSRYNSTPASSTRGPAFKGSGMKLGSKKTKQAELIDALGGDVLATTNISDLAASGPASPAVQEHVPVQKVSGRGSLPEVEAQRYVYGQLTTSFKAISFLIFCLALACTSSSKRPSPSPSCAMEVSNQWK